MKESLHKEKEYLEQYKLMVEAQLSWGESNGWRHQDFESLSEKIFDKTEIMLSSTTLKRIWGKLKYDSIPNTNTLNALASFIGYESWLAFKSAIDKKQSRKEQVTEESTVQTTPNPVFNFNRKNRKKQLLKWGGFALLLAALASGFMMNSQKEYASEDLSKVVFTSEPVAKGIPNTVIFKYDVSHLSPQEVVLQQSWNKKLRSEIDPLAKEVASIYYYPGYFRAKLLVNGQILKEHDLYLKSEGWISTLNKTPEPRYFLPEELMNADFLGVKKEAVEEAQSKSDTPDMVGYHYVDDFGELHSDNFILEASIKNTYEKGDGICQKSRVVILCTEGAMVIPFSIPGCVGDLELFINEQYREGSKHDLSAFGCDFSDWQKFKCDVKNRNAKLYLNEQLIFETPYEGDAGRVVGFRFLFTGDGAVDEVSLKGQDGQVFFEEHFSKNENQG